MKKTKKLDNVPTEKLDGKRENVSFHTGNIPSQLYTKIGDNKGF